MLEQVAGGWAFRASREAAEACGRLFERPVERGLSQAALETLAVVAYLGPCSRPEIARIRGRRGRLGRGGPRRARPDRGGGPGTICGAVRYRVTPLFERVFGLEIARRRCRAWTTSAATRTSCAAGSETLAERRPA